jgi:translation initiation factor IF-3
MASKFRVDRQIRAKEVRYIDHEGKQHGILDTYDAISHAQSVGLSLVEVDPNASPPVCKALDYSRFQYEKKKKSKSTTGVAKKDKEVKINTSTGENDYQVKIRKVISLLEIGHRVKVTVRFRFRRGQHQIIESPEIIQRILDDLKEHGKAEAEPKIDVRQATVYFLKKK